MIHDKIWNRIKQAGRGIESLAGGSKNLVESQILDRIGRLSNLIEYQSPGSGFVEDHLRRLWIKEIPEGGG